MRELGGHGRDVLADERDGEEAARGEIVFNAGGCASCHEVSGRGSVLAADLSDAGTRPAAQIRDGLKHAAPAAGGGGRGGRAPFRLVDVALKGGGKETGALRARDSFSLQLQRKDGSWALFDTAKVAAVTDAPGGVAYNGLAGDTLVASVEDAIAEKGIAWGCVGSARAALHRAFAGGGGRRGRVATRAQAEAALV